MKLLSGYLVVAEPPRLPARQSDVPASEPPLQAQPSRELRVMRVAEDEVLTTYGWVDRDKGIARIPIERALQILAERGLSPSAPGE
jgi:hypothetical protein